MGLSLEVYYVNKILRGPMRGLLPADLYPKVTEVSVATFNQQMHSLNILAIYQPLMHLRLTYLEYVIIITPGALGNITTCYTL